MRNCLEHGAKGIGFKSGSYYFYFVTLSEKNILFEFQKILILFEKMSYPPAADCQFYEKR